MFAQMNKDSANLKAERLACLDYYAHATLPKTLLRYGSSLRPFDFDVGIVETTKLPPSLTVRLWKNW